MLLLVVCSQVTAKLCAALHTCHSWKSTLDDSLRTLVPLRSLDQAELQRLPATFPALTHLAFLEASSDTMKLVGDVVILRPSYLVLPCPLTAQTSMALHLRLCILQADIYNVVEQLPLRSLDIRTLDSEMLWQDFSDGSAVRP